MIEPESLDPNYCQTPTADRICDVLGNSRTLQFMGVVVGKPGTGKTSACRRYAGQHRRITYCRMGASAEKTLPGLVQIGVAIDEWFDSTKRGGEGRAADEVDRLVESYHVEMLIIDEAQHMSDRLLEHVRGIYDRAHIPIVLVGNHGLKERWSGPRGRKFEQLLGRIAFQLDIPRPLPEDVEAIAAHHGIEGSESRKLLLRVVDASGGLHRLERILAAVRALAGDKRPIPFETVQAAAKLAGVGQ